MVRTERDLADEIIETLIISDIPEKKEEKVAEADEEKEDEEDVEITAIIIPDEMKKKKLRLLLLLKRKFFLKNINPEAEAVLSESESAETPGEFEEKLVLVPSSPKPPENGERVYGKKDSEYITEEKTGTDEAAELRKYSSSDSSCRYS